MMEVRDRMAGSAKNYLWADTRGSVESPAYRSKWFYIATIRAQKLNGTRFA